MFADRIVKLHSALGSDTLLFHALRGCESLSRPFEFQLDVLCESPLLDLRQLLGQSVSLEITTASFAPRYLDGQVSAFKLLGKANRTDRYYLYRATLRPWLWFLTHTVDSKIFQEKTVPEVLQEVFGDYRFPWELRLTQDYPRQEYCVQYQESDFTFLSRLMEREGLYYWFEHKKGEHTLVIADDVSKHTHSAILPGLPFQSPDRVTQSELDHVYAWQPLEQVSPGRYATADYDYRKPAASLDAQRSNPAEHTLGDLEVYEWLGGYSEPEQGEHYSRLRLESLQAVRSQVQAKTNSRALAPGFLLDLRNHPRPAENREYLVTQAEYDFLDNGHASDQALASHYRIDFVAAPSDQPYRPARVTALPRTHGPQTAKVVGRRGEELWTDQYGRIKVQFLWDRYGQENENSSCWLRVSSPWAGGGFGGIQLPRVNDEVIVDFIAGDPDRPIVVGRVYNASNMPPWSLPDNATQSGFLSRSKDGDPNNANAFMFEDKAGQERIWLHAERNMDTEIEGDETHFVDGNRTTIIALNDMLTVKGTRTSTVDLLETETFNSGVEREVTGPVQETITGEQTLTHTGDVTQTVTGDVTEELTGNLTQTITGEVNYTATGLFTDKVEGERHSTQTGNYFRTIDGDVERNTQGDVTAFTKGNVSDSTEGNLTHLLTGTVTSTLQGQVTVTADTGIVINTPSWKVNVTSAESWWTPHVAKVTGMRESVVIGSVDAWGVRAQGYVVNFQAAIVKMDYAAIKNDKAHMYIKKSGAFIGATAVTAYRSAARLASAGIHLFF